MSSTPLTRESAPRRYTSAALTIGVSVSALCFVIAIVGELGGVAAEEGEMTDLGAVVSGLTALSPWAWATLGVYGIVLTPVIGLLVTVAEYLSVSERRSALTAIVVLTIFTISAAIAMGLPVR